MNVQISDRENHVLFQVEGKLDSTTSLEFESTVQSKIKETPVNTIFDLHELSYISSSGLRVFLQLAKSAKLNSKEILLTSMQNPVKEIFDLAGFTPFFRIFDSVDKAQSALKNKTS